VSCPNLNTGIPHSHLEEESLPPREELLTCLCENKDRVVNDRDGLSQEKEASPRRPRGGKKESLTGHEVRKEARQFLQRKGETTSNSCTGA